MPGRHRRVDALLRQPRIARSAQALTGCLIVAAGAGLVMLARPDGPTQPRSTPVAWAKSGDAAAARARAVDTARFVAAHVDAAPVDTTPVDTAPVDTAPVDTAGRSTGGVAPRDRTAVRAASRATWIDSTAGG